MRKFSSATKWHNGVLSSVLDSAAFKGFEAQAELSSVTKSLLSTSSLTPSTDAPQNGNIGNFGSKRSFASSATISQGKTRQKMAQMPYKCTPKRVFLFLAPRSPIQSILIPRTCP